MQVNCKLNVPADIRAEDMVKNRFYIVTKNPNDCGVNIPVIRTGDYLSFPQTETWSSSIYGYRVRPLMVGESIIIEG